MKLPAGLVGRFRLVQDEPGPFEAEPNRPGLGGAGGEVAGLDFPAGVDVPQRLHSADSAKLMKRPSGLGPHEKSVMPVQIPYRAKDRPRDDDAVLGALKEIDRHHPTEIQGRLSGDQSLTFASSPQDK